MARQPSVEPLLSLSISQCVRMILATAWAGLAEISDVSLASIKVFAKAIKSLSDLLSRCVRIVSLNEGLEAIEVLDKKI